jgi:drug/metabolite transporter, DME family
MAIKACQLTSWQVASFRCAIAGLALFLFLREARRGFTCHAALVGLCYAATLILFALANKMTTSANAIFLQSAAPLYVLPLSILLLGDRIKRRDLGVMVVIAVGFGLLLAAEQGVFATAPDPATGNLLAALSGLTYALTVIGLRALATKGSALPAVVLGNLIGFLVTLPMALPVESARPIDWVWLLYLGVFQIGLAYVFWTQAAGRLAAFEVSLLLLVEPVFNPLWSFLVHGERPAGLAIAGAALIMLATIGKTWLDLRPPEGPAAADESNPAS